MKAIFNFVAALTLLAVFAPLPAQSQTFFQVRDLLREHFRSSERVSYERVRPAGQHLRRIQERLGAPLPKPEYIVYVAETGGRPDGYAIFDKEIGQHQPIDFATFFDARGNVSRVEVVAYREPYGDGIRSERFRRQFIGKSAATPLRAGKDIDIISGATLSSRSACRAVQRASVLVEEAVMPSHDVIARR